MPRTACNDCCTLCRWRAADVIFTLGLVVFAIVYGSLFPSVYERFFIEQDPFFSYPYVAPADMEVSIPMLVLCVIVFPPAAITIAWGVARLVLRRSVEAGLAAVEGSKSRRGAGDIQGRSYVFLWSLGGPRTASLLTGSLRRQPLTGSLGLALLIWLKAVSWCLLFTEAFKAYSGRYRPNFFAMCNYAGYRDALETGNYTYYLANTVFGRPGNISKCLLPSTLADCTASSPSGHSSLTFAAFTSVTVVVLLLIEEIAEVERHLNTRRRSHGPGNSTGTGVRGRLFSAGRMSLNSDAGDEAEALLGSNGGSVGNGGGGASGGSLGGSAVGGGLAGGLDRAVGLGGIGGTAGRSTLEARTPVLWALRYFRSWVTVLVAVPLAGAYLVAFSRTRDYYHHFSDVLCGAVLGFGTCLMCAYLLLRLGPNHRDAELRRRARKREVGDDGDDRERLESIRQATAESDAYSLNFASAGSGGGVGVGGGGGGGGRVPTL